MPLTGKTALVTRASRGMGRASDSRSLPWCPGSVHYAVVRRTPTLSSQKDAKAVGERTPQRWTLAAVARRRQARQAGTQHHRRSPAHLLSPRRDLRSSDHRGMTVEDLESSLWSTCGRRILVSRRSGLGDGSSVNLVSSLGAHAAVGTLSADAATRA